MQLTTTKTSNLLNERTRLWQRVAQFSEEFKALKNQVDGILKKSGNIHISSFTEFQHYPSEAKEFYQKINTQIGESNQLRSNIGEKQSNIQVLTTQIGEYEAEIGKLKGNIPWGYVFIWLIFPYFMIQSWKEKIGELEEQKSNDSTDIGDKERKISNTQNKIKSLHEVAVENLNKFHSLIDAHYARLLTEHSSQTKKVFQPMPAFKRWEWTSEVWKNWDAKQSEICQYLSVGRFSEQLIKNLEFDVPAYIPLIGHSKTIFLNSNKSTASNANSLMESLILRIALMLPHQVTFTFIDPAGFGKAFPIAGQLDTRESSGDVYRVLEAVMDDMSRMISTYGLSDERPFDFKPENILINERFEFIFAAEFPKQYDRRVIESLQRIANTGHIAGKYVFIQHNQSFALPRDISLSDFENKFELNLNNTNEYNTNRFKFIPNRKPEETFKVQLLEALKKSKPPERKVEWAEEVALPTNKWWREQAIENIETSVGRSGSSEKLEMWFGAKKSEGGRPCVHGILAAMAGSGKSNLYHILVLGLSIRYSPEELSFFLIDGKDGVEFQPYKYLPHAEFVSLKSQPQLSRSILAELIEEKERRNNLFTEHKVNDYESFRTGNPNYVLPRILLLVDEYQELFEGDKEGVASEYLLTIAQQGRSAGIHMLLGSQRFGVVGMLHQAAIFGNIHLRIAMKMALSDRQALTEFGREGKQIIATCNLPGKAVINDQSGEDGANRFGKVAFMTKQKRDQVIEEIGEYAQNSDVAPELLTTNIFHGSQQPNLLDNPQLSYLARSPKWLSEPEMQAFANKAVHTGGLGEISWFAGEKPAVGWLGQEFNVRGQTRIILRRRQRENVLIAGDYNEARFGMLLSLITSFALNTKPSNNEFYIIDKTIPGAPWNKGLRFVKTSLLDPLSCHNHFATKNKKAEELILEVSKELEKRLSIEEDERVDFSNVFLFIAEPDKVERLCQVPSKYGLEDSPLGKTLQEIYIKGPSVGIFVFLAFENVMSIDNVVSKRNVSYFRHRIALQMSEDDSFTFLKRRGASKLQSQGKKPIRSFYLDMGNNRQSIFKPYCLGNALFEQITEIQELLKNR